MSYSPMNVFFSASGIGAVAVGDVAKKAEVIVWDEIGRTDSISFTWRSRLKDRIYDLAGKYSMAGWDGEEASPVDWYAIKVAEQFIDLLPEGVQEPFIAVETAGDFSFDWDAGQDMTFAVIVARDRAIYAGIIGDSRSRGIATIYREIPGPIRDILLEYFRK